MIKPQDGDKAAAGEDVGNNGDNVLKEERPKYPHIEPHLYDPVNVLQEPSRLPGFEGISFRGPVPDLKEDDPRQPQIGYHAHVRIFDMSNQEDIAYYEKIYQVAYNGHATIAMEQVKWDESKGTWLILLRWAVLFSYMPQDIPHRGVI